MKFNHFVYIYLGPGLDPVKDRVDLKKDNFSFSAIGIDFAQKEKAIAIAKDAVAKGRNGQNQTTFLLKFSVTRLNPYLCSLLQGREFKAANISLARIDISSIFFPNKYDRYRCLPKNVAAPPQSPKKDRPVSPQTAAPIAPAATVENGMFFMLSTAYPYLFCGKSS